MEISLNTTYYETSNIQKNTLKANKELKSDKDTNINTDTDMVNNNIIQEKTDAQKLQNNIENFTKLCKQFPDIAFVVIDNNIGCKVLPEYNGICNTSAFGDLDKISIQIQEEVIEKFEEDSDNIIRMIQDLSKDYSAIVKSNAKLSGCKYADAVLHYNGANLSWMYTLYVKYPPTILRETGSLEPSSRDDTADDTREKYFQNLILNMQYDSYNKLFEIGKEDNENEREEEKNYKAKSEQKYIEQYQKSFLYT